MIDTENVVWEKALDLRDAAAQAAGDAGDAASHAAVVVNDQAGALAEKTQAVVARNVRLSQIIGVAVVAGGVGVAVVVIIRRRKRKGALAEDA